MGNMIFSQASNQPKSDSRKFTYLNLFIRFLLYFTSCFQYKKVNCFSSVIKSILIQMLEITILFRWLEFLYLPPIMFSSATFMNRMTEKDSRSVFRKDLHTNYQPGWILGVKILRKKHFTITKSTVQKTKTLECKF